MAILSRIREGKAALEIWSQNARIWLPRRALVEVLWPNARARCAGEESSRHPSGPRWNGASIPSRHLPITPHSYPFFATSVGPHLAGVALLGAIERTALRQMLLGGPGSGCLGANGPAPSGERLQRSGRRRCWSPRFRLTTARSQPDTNYAELLLVHHRPVASAWALSGGGSGLPLARPAGSDGY